MPEAKVAGYEGEVKVQSIATARSGGEVIQAPDGRAAYVAGLNGPAVGDAASLITEGVVAVTKSTSVVFLPGQKVYWDVSNNRATYKTAGDFFVGVCVEVDTVAAATTTVKVELNRDRPIDTIALPGNGADYATTVTSGTVTTADNAGVIRLALDTTAEAQRAEALSEESVAVAGDWIAELEIEVVDNGDDAALDINVGMANAGHASDADSITEAVFIHIDGNALDILAESDDGTTEVAATDTTVNYAEDTKFFVQMDGRDPSDVQIYVNGVLILSGTTFDVSEATGPLKILGHIEKSSNDTPGEIKFSGRVYVSPTP